MNILRLYIYIYNNYYYHCVLFIQDWIGFSNWVEYFLDGDQQYLVGN